MAGLRPEHVIKDDLQGPGLQKVSQALSEDRNQGQDQRTGMRFQEARYRECSPVSGPKSHTLTVTQAAPRDKEPSHVGALRWLGDC